MDKDKLRKFLPVLSSPLWERVIEDILEPELEKCRNTLELHDDPEARGKIKFIRNLLNLKDHARTMLEENE